VDLKLSDAALLPGLPEGLALDLAVGLGGGEGVELDFDFGGAFAQGGEGVEGVDAVDEVVDVAGLGIAPDLGAVPAEGEMGKASIQSGWLVSPLTRGRASRPSWTTSMSTSPSR
jgi:hypothetical protein